VVGIAFVLLAPLGLLGGPGNDAVAPAPQSSTAGLHIPTPTVGPNATVCNPHPYHYALQFTAVSTTSNPHNGCGLSVEAVYHGWAGINGQIQTPTSVVSMSGADHAVGWIGMYWLAQDTWIQIGWYTGIVGIGTTTDCQPGICVRRSGSYGLYVEAQRGSDYSIYDFSHLAPGGRVTYRIERHQDPGCWSVYYNYNVFAASFCGFPSAGGAFVVNELYNPSGSSHMPRSEFGVASRGTNQTLRLRGANGWVDWTTAVKTRQVDERGNPAGRNYNMSGIHSYWNVLTFES
jgi:hypothetical protein